MKTSPSAIEAAHLIERLDRLARSQEAVGLLNAAQFGALRFVARANRFSRTPAALADYLGSTRGTVSQTLIALEQKGYITRRPSERDRRSVMLGLTSLGKDTLEADPILALAADLTTASSGNTEILVATLRDTLLAMLARNGGHPFGICHSCRHFRKNSGDESRMPFHCALLDEPLSIDDSTAICIEQEPEA